MVWVTVVSLCSTCRCEKVWNGVLSEAGQDEVAEVVWKVGWLVCPLVVLGAMVEQIDVCVQEEESATLHSMTMVEAGLFPSAGRGGMVGSVAGKSPGDNMCVLCFG